VALGSKGCWGGGDVDGIGDGDGGGMMDGCVPIWCEGFLLL